MWRLDPVSTRPAARQPGGPVAAGPDSMTLKRSVRRSRRYRPDGSDVGILLAVLTRIRGIHHRRHGARRAAVRRSWHERGLLTRRSSRSQPAMGCLPRTCRGQRQSPGRERRARIKWTSRRALPVTRLSISSVPSIAPWWRRHGDVKAALGRNRRNACARPSRGRQRCSRSASIEAPLTSALATAPPTSSLLVGNCTRADDQTRPSPRLGALRLRLWSSGPSWTSTSPTPPTASASASSNANTYARSDTPEANNPVPRR